MSKPTSCHLKRLSGARCGLAISGGGKDVLAHIRKYHGFGNLFNCSDCEYSSNDFTQFVEHAFSQDHDVIAEALLRRTYDLLPLLLDNVSSLQERIRFQSRPVVKQEQLEQSVLEVASESHQLGQAPSTPPPRPPLTPPPSLPPPSSSVAYTPSLWAHYSGPLGNDPSIPRPTSRASKLVALQSQWKSNSSQTKTPTSASNTVSAVPNAYGSVGQKPQKHESQPYASQEEEAEEIPSHAAQSPQLETLEAENQRGSRHLTCRICSKNLVLWSKEPVQDLIQGLRLDKMENHLETFHLKGTIHLKCPHCPQGFPTQTKLKKHVKEQHRDLGLPRRQVR